MFYDKTWNNKATHPLIQMIRLWSPTVSPMAMFQMNKPAMLTYTKVMNGEYKKSKTEIGKKKNMHGVPAKFLISCLEPAGAALF